MTKKIKLFVVTLMLTLGFFFCFCFTVLSVSADEGVDTQPTTQEEQPKEDEATTDDEQVNQVVDLFLNHLKDLKWDEFEAIIGWFIAYLVAQFGIVGLFAILFIKNKIKEYRSSDTHNKVVEKLDADHKKELEAKEQAFEDKLDAMYVMIDDNNKKNQARIEELTNEKTKEIATELSKVTDYLKEDKKDE